MRTKFNWMYSDVYNSKDVVEERLWSCRWQLLDEPGDDHSTYIMLNVEQEVTDPYWKVYATLELDAIDRYEILYQDTTEYISVEKAKDSAEKWFKSWLSNSFSESLEE